MERFLSNKYTGIKYPFRFNNRGRVDTSTTTQGNSEHVKNSIQQICETEIGERFFNPDFGIKLRSLVFKPMNNNVKLLYKNLVAEAIGKWDKRVLMVMGVQVNNVAGKMLGDIKFSLDNIEKYNSISYDVEEVGGSR